MSKIKHVYATLIMLGGGGGGGYGRANPSYIRDRSKFIGYPGWDYWWWGGGNTFL